MATEGRELDSVDSRGGKQGAAPESPGSSEVPGHVVGLTFGASLLLHRNLALRETSQSEAQPEQRGSWAQGPAPAPDGGGLTPGAATGRCGRERGAQHSPALRAAASHEHPAVQHHRQSQAEL